VTRSEALRDRNRRRWQRRRRRRLTALLLLLPFALAAGLLASNVVRVFGDETTRETPRARAGTLEGSREVAPSRSRGPLVQPLPVPSAASARTLRLRRLAFEARYSPPLLEPPGSSVSRRVRGEMEWLKNLTRHSLRLAARPSREALRPAFAPLPAVFDPASGPDLLALRHRDRLDIYRDLIELLPGERRILLASVPEPASGTLLAAGLIALLAASRRRGRGRAA